MNTAVVVREPVSDDGAAEPAARRVGLEDFAAFSEQVGERESGESAPEDAERHRSPFPARLVERAFIARIFRYEVTRWSRIM